MVRCDPKRFCEAIFEDATVNLDLIKGEVKIYKKKSLINYKFSSDIDKSYKNMWHNYILKNKTTSIRNLIKNSLLILRIIDVIKNNKF